MSKIDGTEAFPTVEEHREKDTDLRDPELAGFWLASLVDSADDAIISKTLEGIITSWNKGAERIFGYKPEEAIGHSVTLLIPPGHEDEEPNILSKLRAGELVEH
jgi:PAS domain S-box-containing protein